MRFFVVALAVFATLAASACDSGPSPLDQRAKAFETMPFTEDNVRRVIEDVFHTENFQLAEVRVTEPGTAEIEFDVGKAMDKRMLMLRAAAAAYTYGRILLPNKDARKISLVQYGTLTSRSDVPVRFLNIALNLTREQAELIPWPSLERSVTFDRDFDPVLAKFNVTYLDPRFAEVLSAGVGAQIEKSGAIPR